MGPTETGWTFWKSLVFRHKSNNRAAGLRAEAQNGLLVLITFQDRLPVDTAYPHPQLLLLWQGQCKLSLLRRGMLEPSPQRLAEEPLAAHGELWGIHPQ